MIELWNQLAARLVSLSDAAKAWHELETIESADIVAQKWNEALDALTAVRDYYDVEFKKAFPEAVDNDDTAE